MKAITASLLLCSGLMLFCGCNSSKEKGVTDAKVVPENVILGSEPRDVMPRAVAYRTNGDYSQYVTISVNPQGQVLSFPDPRDVGEQSVPINLGDGWLLDRRGGIGPDTRFIRITYSDYHNLPAPPSIFELKEAIIKDARVTQTMVFNDLTPRQAAKDPEKVKKLIRAFENNR